jgi:hypothetical protein
MDKHSDLLPWILGGLLLATLAIAVTAGSTHRTVPKILQAPSQTAAPALAQVEMPAAPAPAPAPASVPAMAVAQIQSAPPPAASGNQIWECKTNGQRTFSNHPCGEKSFLREIGPINGMDPTPILPPTRSYESQSSYSPEYTYPDAQDSAYNTSPMLVAIPFIERRRAGHTHRPYRHDHGPAARRY